MPLFKKKPEMSLKELEAEQARLRRELVVKQQEKELKDKIKQEKKNLQALKSELHPTAFQKLSKGLNKAEKLAVASGKELGKYGVESYKELAKSNKKYKAEHPEGKSSKKIKEVS